MLYKNLSKKYRDEFWDQGKVRVGALSSFQDTGDVREDRLEGTRGTVWRPTEPIRVFTNELWTPGNISIKSVDPDKRAYVYADVGAKVNFHEVLPEAYVFCVSEGLLIPDFGDAAYQIIDANGFGKTLLRALRNTGEKIAGGTVRKVKYGGYKNAIGDKAALEAAQSRLQGGLTLDDYFMKSTDYVIEKEWRFLFLLDDDEKAKSYIDIVDPELREYCYRV